MNYQFSKYALPTSKPYVLPTPVYLWPNGLGLDDVPEQQWTNRDENFYNHWVDKIFKPALYPFIAEEEKRTGQAVVVCPGGGYAGTAFDKEGVEIARLLNENGISAFVLNYRDAAAPSGDFGIWPEGPLSDALRSIRYVRRNAESFGIDGNKIGIMGFSSGGHVALTASTLYGSYEEKDAEWAAIDARPDFTIAIYPVCSFISEKQHRGSVLRLLGGFPTMETLLRFSPERNVNENTPQAFLVHTLEDSGVPYQNSLLYFQALADRKIPVEMHLFPHGQHGYGMLKFGNTTDGWENLLVNWLKHLQ